MADLETSSPDSNYASRSNIVLPHPRAGGSPTAAEVAVRAKADIEGRIGLPQDLPASPLASKTLSAVSTPKQET